MRLQWLNNYKAAVGNNEIIDKDVVNYILDEEEVRTCICDTPMTLYMMVAKKGVSSMLSNNWALYHHIFYEELSETDYNEMFPDPDRDYSHYANRIREVLYQISEEIAFMMYKRGNTVFYLSDTELRAIIRELSERLPVLSTASVMKIAENCFGICCYWKANKDRGAMEFLHNDVRDFFLAEKIYREIDSLIFLLKNKGDDDFNITKKICSLLCNLFSYGVLETRVTEFIYLRAAYNKENDIYDFASFEIEKDLVGTILVMLNQDEIAKSKILDQHSFVDIIQRIINIITCTVQIYRYAYHPYLEGKYIINWELTKGDNNFSNIWKNIFKAVFCQVPVTLTTTSMISMASYGNFSGLNLQSCDLRNIGFDHSVIEDGNFSDTILTGCDFSNAILNNTTFENADLHFASLEQAIIKGCSFKNTDLRGTKLPDRFVSMEQEEQLNHLKGLDIPGLIV